MSRRILKFPIEVKGAEVEGVQIVQIPKGHEVLSAIEQNGLITLYAICDINAEYENVKIVVVGTGSQESFRLASIEHDRFLDTVKVDRFVWHIFIPRNY
jgi:hypothetical protein